MRKAVDHQRRLDCPSITQVRLNLDCRTETIPILRALQHIYSQPELRDSILRSIGQDVNGKSSAKRGRKGLAYWEILVLAGVRLGCNFDYDQLQDLAQQHRSLQHIMGVGDWDDEKSKAKFDWRRIQDNLTLLSPETIAMINAAIVGEGHRLKPAAAETVRGDSFVAETNIHYPTDSSLIRDGVRKITRLAADLAALLSMAGWRQHKHLFRKTKKLARGIDRIASKKGGNYQERLKPLYRDLLDVAGTVCGRADELREAAKASGGDMLRTLALDQELETFLQRMRQVCEIARRRVLCGETIANEEKLFSMFEPHTQLYKRGKAGQEIQLGRLVLIFENGAGFISHYSVMARDQGDKDVVVAETRKAQELHGGRIRRASFDRGFHSPENQEELAKIVANPCLPKPGALQAAEQEKTASVEFRQARQSHPGVESAIGALQSGNGLERCRDRTERGFERYIGLGVLGRNLHVLGKLLIAEEAPNCVAACSRRKPAA
jgi:IS5 family transposase